VTIPEWWTRLSFRKGGVGFVSEVSALEPAGKVQKNFRNIPDPEAVARKAKRWPEHSMLSPDNTGFPGDPLMVTFIADLALSQ
jgi:hypothetical protein